MTEPLPIFGRRSNEPEAGPPVAASPAAAPSHAAAPRAGNGRAFGGAAAAKAAPAGNAATHRADVAELRALCLTRMDAAAVASLPPERLLIEVERLISDLATERRVQLNGKEQRSLATELVDDMLGLGPLEPLLLDESINDIMVNGPDHTFVERSGKLVQVPVHFRDWTHLTNICQRIAASVGRRVDEASPMVDARLKDGSRVNIILPPLALDGPALSIRKFSKKPIDFEKLISYGSLTAPIARILEIAARCRLNIIVSGGTGSGKTTMMNAMSRFIDPAERVVTVEDAAELQLQQPHVVRLETRPASLEGKGEVNARDLVRNALRMRPDRIIIGEVRGAEAFDMLQAMNTGHDGSMSTIHANNTRDALARIENMVQMSSMGLSPKAIRTPGGRRGQRDCAGGAPARWRPARNAGDGDRRDRGRDAAAQRHLQIRADRRDRGRPTNRPLRGQPDPFHFHGAPAVFRARPRLAASAGRDRVKPDR